MHYFEEINFCGFLFIITFLLTNPKVETELEKKTQQNIVLRNLSFVLRTTIFAETWLSFKYNDEMHSNVKKGYIVLTKKWHFYHKLNIK